MRAAIGPGLCYSEALYRSPRPTQLSVHEYPTRQGDRKSALLLRSAQKRDRIPAVCIMHLLALSICRIGRAGEGIQDIACIEIADEDQSTRSGKNLFQVGG